MAGLGLEYWVPAAAGSGIPQVKVAFTNRFGSITFKETVGKFVLCVVQLGGGASLGVEGPTVHICSGVSSFLARVARLSPKNCRRMTSVGMAAGIAAAFNAPIAAVTFTLEELIGSLDQTMLAGVIVAAALAAVVENRVLGNNPIFHVPQELRAWQRLFAGLVCAAGAAGGHCLGHVYRFAALAARLVQAAQVRAQVGASGHWRRGHGQFRRGGNSVLSSERHCRRPLQDAHAGPDRRPLADVGAMVALCLLKLAATVTSYSSGGAGGIFAPALFMGGMLGGAVGYIDVAVFHHPADSIGAFAVVGMGAVFAGAVRAPMTSILIIFEMTGGYGLVLPLMIANMSAFALARHWRHTPVYDALLEQDGIFLHRKPRPHEPAEPPQLAAEQMPLDASV